MKCYCPHDGCHAEFSVPDYWEFEQGECHDGECPSCHKPVRWMWEADVHFSCEAPERDEARKGTGGTAPRSSRTPSPRLGRIDR